jgi:hypothetical protein
MREGPGVSDKLTPTKKTIAPSSSAYSNIVCQARPSTVPVPRGKEITVTAILEQHRGFNGTSVSCTGSEGVHSRRRGLSGGGA